MKKNDIEPDLARLSHACGVETEFVDALGIRRLTSRATLIAVLNALSVETGSKAAMRRESKRLAATRAREESPAGARCFAPPGRRVGIYANLYSVRATPGSGSADFGDFSALFELIELASRRGLDYIAINPLHAIRNRKLDASPYYPVSRLFKNPLYIDPHAVPELAETDRFRRRHPQRPHRQDVLDYEAIASQRFTILREAHRKFVAGTHDARRRADYLDFVRTGGEDLRRFAIYQALDEFHGSRGRFGFRNWPVRFQDPTHPAVSAFAREHHERVAFHLWLQFEVARQWHGAGEHARRLGMRLGLLTDLAIGAAPDSADVWMRRDDHVDGFSLGAPPDGYSTQGQVWGLPPLNPLRISNGRDAFFRRLVAAAMDGAGAVRIDHAIGLIRQYWVPNGAPGTDGVMVKMPRRQLFETIAQESRRSRCVVIAEDLGTIPEELPRWLAAHRMLSTRVLLFSRDGRGEFESPKDYPKPAAASIGTHDLVPFAGWLDGADLPIQARLGLIASKQELATRRAGRKYDVAALRRMLRREGVLASRASSKRAMLDAVHRSLVRSPCDLITLALDDLALETTPINVPTATADRYPVWSRRMKRSLTAIERAARSSFPRQPGGHK